MADHFTTTCFQIVVTTTEAALLREVQAIALAIECNDPVPAPSADFLATFPDAHGEEPLTAFRSIFQYPEWPRLDGDIITVPVDTEPNKVTLTWGSMSEDPDTIARVFQRSCPSALPFRFGHANTCSRDVPGAFSGGWTEVRADAIVWLNGPNDQRGRKFVIEAPCADDGKVYWNSDRGFGPLTGATVLTEEEAGEMELPMQDGANWVPLPQAA